MMDGDYNCFNLILRTLGFFQKIGKMLNTSMSDYEKSGKVTYPFYFIKRQSIHNKNCMQRIKKILMREVYPAIALNNCKTPCDGSKLFLKANLVLLYVGACVASCLYSNLLKRLVHFLLNVYIYIIGCVKSTDYVKAMPWFVRLYVEIIHEL